MYGARFCSESEGPTRAFEVLRSLRKIVHRQGVACHTSLEEAELLLKDGPPARQSEGGDDVVCID